MSVENFLDTNVFVYLFDETDDFKRGIAERLVHGALGTTLAASVFKLLKKRKKALLGICHLPYSNNSIGCSMNRDEVLKQLRTHKPILSQRFGVTNLALFGSVARNEISDDSDIDILVRFDQPGTSKA